MLRLSPDLKLQNYLCLTAIVQLQIQYSPSIWISLDANVSNCRAAPVTQKNLDLFQIQGWLPNLGRSIQYFLVQFSENFKRELIMNAMCLITIIPIAAFVAENILMS